MKNIVSVISCPGSVAHEQLAVEALKATSSRLGFSLQMESGSLPVLSSDQIGRADVVLLVGDDLPPTARFAGKPLYQTRIGDVISRTEAVLQAASGLIPKDNTRNGALTSQPSAADQPKAAPKRLVGITACPTGIAHTFMAAEALNKAARELGFIIKVETQGSVGAKNTLTTEEIAAADAVVIAADTNVDLARFAGKALYTTSTKEALHHGAEVLKTALQQPVPSTSPSGLAATIEQAKAERSKARSGPYKHLMTGVSHMLPLVTAGGLCIALAFAIGGIYAGNQPGTMAWALSQIGGATAFHLFVAVFSGYIAYSIADRPGLTPGLIGGMLAQNLGAGFLGGIVSGFLAGYFTKFLNDKIRLPNSMEGLKPVLILPFLSSVVVGLLMIFVIAPPVQSILTATTSWLNAMQGANALLLGVILGSMMAFDMGGPINKAAYTFAVGLLASKVYGPMAAVMAAGMVPPLGLALAAWIFKNRFDADEQKAGGPAFVLGLCFITEGAIPFAAKDPLRTIPPLMIGAAATGALSMLFQARLLVPHGGIFAVLIPGAVSPLLPYLLSVAVGTVITAAALFVLKRPIAAQA